MDSVTAVGLDGLFYYSMFEFISEIGSPCHPSHERLAVPFFVIDPVPLHGRTRSFRRISNFHLLPISCTVAATGQLCLLKPISQSEKKLVPASGKVFDFENIQEALTAQDEGTVNGKIVVKV